MHCEYFCPKKMGGESQMKRITVIGSVALSAVCCIGMAYKGYQFFSTQKNYHYQVDSLMSDAVSQKMNSFLHADGRHYWLLSSLCTALQNEFPIVQTIQARYGTADSIYLTLKAHEPLVSVNNNFLLLANGALVERDYFVANAIADLANITVLHDGLPSDLQLVKEYITKVPYELLQQYRLCWVDATQVRWYDKHDANFYVITDGATVPDDRLLAHCALVKQELKTKPNAQKKVWAADVRFRNQIVIKGGELV